MTSDPNKSDGGYLEQPGLDMMDCYACEEEVPVENGAYHQTADDGEQWICNGCFEDFADAEIDRRELLREEPLSEEPF